MFETLDSDSMRHILSYLDTYQYMSLALSNRFLYNKLYDENKANEIQSHQISIKKNRKQLQKIINGISNSGVRRGTCQYCHKIGLLHSPNRHMNLSSATNHESRKWICIEHCVFKCLQCETRLYSQNIDGWHEPVMCHVCHQRFSFR
jgi:hypothetical protein